MFCSKCGNQVSDSAKFCAKCGNVINGANVGVVKVTPNAAPNQPVNQNASTQVAMNKKKKSKMPFIIIGVAVAAIFFMIIVAVVVLVLLLGGKGSNSGASGGNNNPFAGGLAVGDTVYFGEYEQDNNTGNGAEPIMWDVIGQGEGGFLLISHYVLDYKPFQEGGVSIVDYATGDVSSGITWESSSIRQWLNNDFMQSAFSSDEQGYIIPVMNTTSDFKETLGQEEHYYNMQGGIGGADTTDSVFLLSIEDYFTYMDPAYAGHFSYIYVSVDALAAPTKYARAMGAVVINYADGDNWLKEQGCSGTLDADYEGVYTPWLLRNPGSALDNVTVMSVDDLGYAAASQNVSGACGIRPAIWVSAPANGNSVAIESDNTDVDAYSQCIGYWKPNNVDSMSAETFWIQAPQVMEITEYSVIIHGPGYSANREELQHAERDGIDYFTSSENGFRFYYSPNEELLVLELRTEDGGWMRWADFN